MSVSLGYYAWMPKRLSKRNIFKKKNTKPINHCGRQPNMCASPKRKSGALLINKTTSDAFKKPWPINHDNFTSFLLMNKTIIQQDAFVCAHTCVFSNAWLD